MKNIIKRIVENIKNNNEFQALLKDFLATYNDNYNKKINISEYGKKYLFENYPINKEGYISPLSLSPASKRNALLGGIFVVGYNIRVAEAIFQNQEIKKNKPHKKQATKNPNEYKSIVDIACSIDKKGELIGIGPEIKDHAVIDYDTILKIFDYFVKDYIDFSSKKYKYKLDDLTEEVFYRNAAFGYYFRMAEEMVDCA